MTPSPTPSEGKAHLMTDARKALAEEWASAPIFRDRVLLRPMTAAERDLIVAALRPLPGTREEVARPEDNEHPNVASGLFARETEDQAKALPPAPMPEREGMREARSALREIREHCASDRSRRSRDCYDLANRALAALAPHDKTDLLVEFKITSYPNEIMGEGPHDKTEG